MRISTQNKNKQKNHTHKENTKKVGKNKLANYIWKKRRRKRDKQTQKRTHARTHARTHEQVLKGKRTTRPGKAIPSRPKPVSRTNYTEVNNVPVYTPFHCHGPRQTLQKFKLLSARYQAANGINAWPICDGKSKRKQRPWQSQRFTQNTTLLPNVTTTALARTKCFVVSSTLITHSRQS